MQRRPVLTARISARYVRHFAASKVRLTGPDPNPRFTDEIWYRFNGVQLGYVGNTSTSQLTASTSFNDFSQAYDAVNSFAQGPASGSYIIQRSGETLSSMARLIGPDPDSEVSRTAFRYLRLVPEPLVSSMRGPTETGGDLRASRGMTLSALAPPPPIS